MKTNSRSYITLSGILSPGGLLTLLLVSGGASAVSAGTEAGQRVAADRKLGNCYSCHMVVGAELTGNAGPPLVQMKSRFPDRAALRAQIADPRASNPNTIMPPYGAHNILTERQLDDLVDYVLSL